MLTISLFQLYKNAENSFFRDQDIYEVLQSSKPLLEVKWQHCYRIWIQLVSFFASIFTYHLWVVNWQQFCSINFDMNEGW